MTEPWSVERCPQCGGVVTRVEDLRPIRRLRQWFNYGARPRGQVDYACSTCSHGVSVSTFFVPSGHSLRGRIRYFRSRRNLEPTPRFYVNVAVAGIGGGILMSWVSGRRQARWQVPCVALAVSWLLMESSVFWGAPPAPDADPSRHAR